MIQYAAGDVTEAQAFANPVNTQGVMGAGLAKQVREKWPECMRPYKLACETGMLRIGSVLAWRRPDDGWIVHVPTKRYWRDGSQLAGVRGGIEAMLEECRKQRIGEIAVPALGCGLGGLQWDPVHAALKAAARRYPSVQMVIYPPRQEE